MSTTAGEAFGLSAPTEAPLDPSTFNLDDWIDEVTRPTEIVRLYGKGHLNERLKELEREIALSRKVPEEDRGITDESPESLQAQWDDVAAELLASARPFKVQALTSDELDAARAEAKRAKVSDSDVILFILARAIVEPAVTAAQLTRLRAAGGDAGLAEMYAVVLRLSNNQVRPTPFSSAKRSGGTGG